LPAVAGHPVLMLGRDLRTFLRQRREHAKRPCRSDEMFCLRCRMPRMPAGDMVEYQSATPTRGRLVGLCSCCGAVMYRSVNPSRIPRNLASMVGPVQAGRGHIGESTRAIVNSDFGEPTG
jgi:hypothetical protein